jgi:hypothetical protein
MDREWFHTHTFEDLKRLRADRLVKKSIEDARVRLELTDGETLEDPVQRVKKMAEKFLKMTDTQSGAKAAKQHNMLLSLFRHFKHRPTKGGPYVDTSLYHSLIDIAEDWENNVAYHVLALGDTVGKRKDNLATILCARMDDACDDDDEDGLAFMAHIVPRNSIPKNLRGASALLFFTSARDEVLRFIEHVERLVERFGGSASDIKVYSDMRNVVAKSLDADMIRAAFDEILSGERPVDGNSVLVKLSENITHEVLPKDEDEEQVRTFDFPETAVKRRRQ